MKYINSIDGSTYKPYTYRMDYPGGYYYEGSKYEEGCNPDNTKDYEGTRKSDKPKAELHRELMGTGIKTITGLFDTKEQAVMYESIRHEALDLDDPLCLNLGKQTSSGFSYSAIGTKWGQDHRRDHFLSGKDHPQFGLKGEKSHRFGVEPATKGGFWCNNGLSDVFILQGDSTEGLSIGRLSITGSNNPTYGGHTDATKAKMRKPKSTTEKMKKPKASCFVPSLNRVMAIGQVKRFYPNLLSEIIK